jgi:hypothetical protein
LARLTLPSLFLFCIGLATGGLAQTIRYAGELTQIPVSCRSIAMGEATVALPAEPFAAFINPGSAAFAQKRTISAAGARLFSGLGHHIATAMNAPVQNYLSLGTSYTAFFPGDLIRWDSLPGTPEQRLYQPDLRADGADGLGVFHNNHHQILATVSRLVSLPVPRPAGFSVPLPVDLGVGVNFKHYWQIMNPDGEARMGSNSNLDVGGCLRIGVGYDLDKEEISRALSFGIAVRDVLPSRMIWAHSYEDYQEPVDSRLQYGIAYIDRTEILGAHWTAAASLGGQYSSRLRLGLEAQLWEMVAFRAGLAESTPTFGAGIRSGGLQLDYAMSLDALAFSPIRLALTLAF